MAENDKKEKAAPAESGDDESSSKKKRKLIVLIGVAVVAIGGGLGAFFMLKGKSPAPQGHEASKEPEHGKSNEAESKDSKEPAADAHGKSKEASAHGEDKEKDSKEGKHGAEDKKDEAAESGHGKDAKSGKEGAEHGEGSSKKDGKETKAEENISFGRTYTFKPFHLNLGNPLENRYIRLEIAVEFLGGESQQKELTARETQLRDAIISVTSRKTREFLLSPDGKDQLRLEILNQLNQYMDKKLERVFITEILIE